MYSYEINKLNDDIFLIKNYNIKNKLLLISIITMDLWIFQWK
jgi:hypothetical protein